MTASAIRVPPQNAASVNMLMIASSERMSTNEIGKNLGRLEHFPEAIRGRLSDAQVCRKLDRNTSQNPVRNPLDVRKETVLSVTNG